MKLRALFAAALLAATAPTAVAAGGVVPVGTPFRVDDGSLPVASPVVAMRADGSFVVSWEDSLGVIYLRRYAAGGAAQGAAFAVTSPAAGRAQLPRLSMNAAGDFAVAWGSPDDATGITQVHARVFRADGTPLGAEFRADDDAHAFRNFGFSIGYALALGADDRLLAAWTAIASTKHALLNDNRVNMGLFVRRFTAAGIAVDAAAQDINDGGVVLTQLSSPSIAVADDGHYLAAWGASGEECILQPPGGVACDIDLRPLQLRFRQLDASGKPKASQGTVLSAILPDQSGDGRLEAAMNGAGEFVLTWLDASALQARLIHSQAYTPAGLAKTAAGADVPQKIGSGNATPALAVDAQGDYVIGFRTEVQVHAVGPLGGVRPLGPELTAPITNIAAAGMSANNQFVMIGTALPGTAGNTAGIFAQLYSFTR